MKSVLILGRQPAIGLAELESLYGSASVTPVGLHAAQLAIEPSEVAFSRIGGSTRLCQQLVTISSTNREQILKQLATILSTVSQQAPPGKLTIGLSSVGLKIDLKWLLRAGLELKKSLRSDGRSVRLVPNKALELNSAQIIHNKLTSPNGCELVLTKNNNEMIIAKTTRVQDIASYTARDRARPKRDTRVGMLPPKLAQIVINFATGNSEANFDATILDPFCGTGVILQEAALMGFDVYGSDLEPRMIEYTDKNLIWLLDQPNCLIKQPESTKNDSSWRYFKLETADATDHKWQPPANFIACETYLGRPFSAPPSAEVLSKVVQNVNTIHKKFLANVARQTNSGFRMCIAVPAWQTRPGNFQHLPVIDQLNELGYNRVSFKHVRSEDLIYFRQNQIVARELLVLTRK